MTFVVPYDDECNSEFTWRRLDLKFMKCILIYLGENIWGDRLCGELFRKLNHITNLKWSLMLAIKWQNLGIFYSNASLCRELTEFYWVFCNIFRLISLRTMVWQVLCSGNWHLMILLIPAARVNIPSSIKLKKAFSQVLAITFLMWIFYDHSHFSVPCIPWIMYSWSCWHCTHWLSRDI